MTRETKLGLLVGLVFIIVVAVLVADHLAQMSDPKPALLSDAATDALKALQIPGGPNPAMQAPVEPQNVVPVRPVMTVAEVANQARQGSSVVEVGAPAGQAPLQIVANRSAQQVGNAIVNDAATPPLIAVGGPVMPLANGGTRAGALPEVGTMAGATTRSAQPLVAVREAPKTTEIKAAAGDNVAKWAKKYLGADTPANRDAIVKVNPGLSGSLQNIKVGKSYFVPVPAPKPAPVATATPAANTVAALPTTLPAAAVATATEPAANERFYTVKAGDNLWKIAREQCRDAKAMDEIRKLNKDALKGGDALKVGSKLRLPAR